MHAGLDVYIPLPDPTTMYVHAFCWYLYELATAYYQSTGTGGRRAATIAACASDDVRPAVLPAASYN